MKVSRSALFDFQKQTYFYPFTFYTITFLLVLYSSTSLVCVQHHRCLAAAQEQKSTNCYTSIKLLEPNTIPLKNTMCSERLKTSDLYVPHWGTRITDTALGYRLHPHFTVSFLMNSRRATGLQNLTFSVFGSLI